MTIKWKSPKVTHWVSFGDLHSQTILMNFDWTPVLWKTWSSGMSGIKNDPGQFFSNLNVQVWFNRSEKRPKILCIYQAHMCGLVLNLCGFGWGSRNKCLEDMPIKVWFIDQAYAVNYWLLVYNGLSTEIVSKHLESFIAFWQSNFIFVEYNNNKWSLHFVCLCFLILFF